MKTPVKFELAKLLKEKGFNQKSTDIGYNINGENSFDYTLDRINGIGIAAPTIAEVVMWLYEKHGIWISVDTDINGRFRYILRKYNNIDRAWEVKNNISISEYFNSPTEAYEAAIEYTLKNLIL